MDNQISRFVQVLRHYPAFFLVASIAVASIDTFLLAAFPAAGAAHRSNFVGITMSDTIAEIQQVPDNPKFKPLKDALKNGATPPDTIGAVGPQHIVEMTNGGYAVYRKNGTSCCSVRYQRSGKTLALRLLINDRSSSILWSNMIPPASDFSPSLRTIPSLTRQLPLKLTAFT
jgi:hypothetical protein